MTVRAVCYCFTPVFAGRCRVVTRGFPSPDTVFQSVSVAWMQFSASSNRFPGSTLVIFLRVRLWPVGACAFHIQPAKRTLRTSTNVATDVLSFWFCSHRLQSGAWASPLLPTVVHWCQQYPNLFGTGHNTL